MPQWHHNNNLWKKQGHFRPHNGPKNIFISTSPKKWIKHQVSSLFAHWLLYYLNGSRLPQNHHFLGPNMVIRFLLMAMEKYSSKYCIIHFGLMIVQLLPQFLKMTLNSPFHFRPQNVKNGFISTATKNWINTHSIIHFYSLVVCVWKQFHFDDSGKRNGVRELWESKDPPTRYLLNDVSKDAPRIWGMANNITDYHKMGCCISEVWNGRFIAYIWNVVFHVI